MRAVRSGWPAIAWASAALAGWLTFGDVDSPVRVLAVLWFVLLCPGMAIVRLLAIADPIAELTLAVAVSIGLAGLVAGVGLYAHAWSPDAGLAVLIAVAVVVSALPRPGRDAQESS